MTNEQIEQNAKNFAINKTNGIAIKYFPCKEGYIAGAHSRDEEIKDLQLAYNNLVNSFNERGRELAKASQELDKLRNPWISVYDRLPKVGEFVFVSLANGYVYRGVLYDYVEKIWYVDEYGIVDVTHWMPIPQIEKGE